MSDNISQDVNIEGEGNIVIGKARDVIVNPLPPAETRLRHDLGILLKNVENTWIKGVLEKSVHETALLELGMEFREDAVDNPWRMVIESSDRERHVLPRGTKIRDAFDEANRLLLILGEPGSGKTTTMLQLALDLIADVDEAFTQPVPVILNLSTWTNKQQPLDNWLISELNGKYRLPKKDGRSWLREHRILPLLDGLDEVKAENRGPCVEKINQLVNDYGLQGIVVCSRFKDYSDLHVRLAFNRAIYLQSLTPEQVDEYLQRAGDKLAGLRAVLKDDEPLLKMAQSPLILNIMSLAYQSTSTEAHVGPLLTTDEARLKDLFDTYITRMFKRKAGLQPYHDQPSMERLSWLAHNLQQHNQEVFLIENLQPSWLPIRRLQWIYFLISRLAEGLGIGLSFALSLGLLIREPYLGRLILDFALFMLLAGPVSGIFVGIVDAFRFEWLRKQSKKRKLSPLWWVVINLMIVWLICGLINGLLVLLLFVWFSGASVVFAYVISIGTSVGLVCGIIFGIKGSRQSTDIDIETVEALSWSWRKAAQGALVGGGAGLVSGLLVGTLESSLFRWLFWALPCTSFFVPVAALISGLHREVVETKFIPNQGIRLSVRNAIFRGLLLGLIVGMLIGLLIGLLFGLLIQQGIDAVNLLPPMIFLAALLGSLGVLWYGGFDIIQHYTLRLILVMKGFTPANYSHFLDYAVDRIFLQRVGGGYRFIHRMLLEHFADMYERK